MRIWPELLIDNDGRLPEIEPETPLEQAQVLVYQAAEAEDPDEVVRLAKRAIEISPDCVDAYLMLAEFAPGPAQEYALVTQAVAAGERALGQEQIEAQRGHFWGLVETRPYMRALNELAELTLVLGDRAGAIATYVRMLDLNPNDNQGVRYRTASLLLEERTEAAHARLRKLLAEYQDDPAACWAYSRALLAFQEAGAATPDAERALKAAIKVNRGVPAYLLGHRQLPLDMPEYMQFGADSEAVDYAASAYRAWILTPGAMAWLREASDGRGRRRF